MCILKCNMLNMSWYVISSERVCVGEDGKWSQIIASFSSPTFTYSSWIWCSSPPKIYLFCPLSCNSTFDNNTPKLYCDTWFCLIFFPGSECKSVCCVTGMIWSECKEIWADGPREYVMHLWNVLDFGMLSIFVASFTARLMAFLKASKAQLYVDLHVPNNDLSNASLPADVAYFTYGQFRGTLTTPVGSRHCPMAAGGLKCWHANIWSEGCRCKL